MTNKLATKYFFWSAEASGCTTFSFADFLGKAAFAMPLCRGSAVGITGSAAIGPIVAIYGVVRLMYDGASYNANHLIERGMDPFWHDRINKQ